jgi:hypothetical protein
VVEVQSLPYTKPYRKGAVNETVQTPGKYFWRGKGTDNLKILTIIHRSGGAGYCKDIHQIAKR